MAKKTKLVSNLNTTICIGSIMIKSKDGITIFLFKYNNLYRFNGRGTESTDNSANLNTTICIGSMTYAEVKADVLANLNTTICIGSIKEITVLEAEKELFKYNNLYRFNLGLWVE